MLRDEYFQIHEEMKKIETAEDWDNFQQHHEDIYERYLF